MTHLIVSLGVTATIAVSLPEPTKTKAHTPKMASIIPAPNPAEGHTQYRFSCQVFSSLPRRLRGALTLP